MKIGLRKMHERGSPQSECPMHAGNLVLKRGENTFFREVTVAWAKAYGQAPGYNVSDAIHRFLHNFNVDSCGYSVSIRSRSPRDVQCAMPLLLYSTEHLHSFTGSKSCGHSPFLYEDIIMDHGWSVPGTTSLPCLCSLRKCFSQNWQHGKKVESGGDRIHLICHHWASAVKMVLLIQPSSVAAEWAFSLLRPAFSGQQQAAFKIMRRAAWCFTTIIAETIMLMCSS